MGKNKILFSATIGGASGSGCLNLRVSNQLRLLLCISVFSIGSGVVDGDGGRKIRGNPLEGAGCPEGSHRADCL